MERTFSSEDNRKNKVFEAWIRHLGEIHTRFSQEDFQEFYQGTATVSELNHDTMALHLEDGRRVCPVPITPEIKSASAILDSLGLVLGRRNETWWPVDVISIGSLIDCRKDGLHGMHLTLNPLYCVPPIPATGLH